VIAQASAGGGQVEDLDHLGAEGTGELAVGAECVLAGDAALLVGGGAEREIAGGGGERVVGLGAVAGRPHVRQRAGHRGVDGDGAARAESCIDVAGERGLGLDTDRYQNHVGAHVQVGLAAHAQIAVLAADGGHGGRGVHVNAVRHKLGVQDGAQGLVDGGEHFWEALNDGDAESALDEGLGAFQADVASADDHRRPCISHGVVERERVVHRVQKMHAVKREAVKRRADRLGAGWRG
jgi:hypothetical protein